MESRRGSSRAVAVLMSAGVVVAGAVVLAGCLGPDMVDAAADHARDFAQQLAVAAEDERDRLAQSTAEARFRAVRDLLSDAEIYKAGADLVEATREGEVGTYLLSIHAAASRGGGWTSSDGAVRMCVRYVVDLVNPEPIVPEPAGCGENAPAMPDRYVEVGY